MRIDNILIGILIAILFRVATWYNLQIYEGFVDPQSRYQALQKRLRTELDGYCKLTEFVQSQMKTMYKTALKETDIQADEHILQTYRDIYSCKDEFSGSRATCNSVAGTSRKISGEFIPCSSYMKLPLLSPSTQGETLEALVKIPDDLPNRIVMESEYYSLILDKLKQGLELAKNPPGAPPNSSSSPSTDSTGKSWSVTGEGFMGAICSPAAAQAKKELMRKQALEQSSIDINKEARSCKLPTPEDELKQIDSEITRINVLLDSTVMKSATTKLSTTLNSMVKVQSDIETVKKKWGDDLPKKSYVQFKGGDRKESLLFSMQQVK